MKSSISSLKIIDGRFSNENLPSYYDDTSILYEVFRIESGAPVFLSDHLLRLKTSIEKLDLTFDLTESEIKNLVYKLIEKANEKNRNVRIELFFSSGKSKIQHYHIYFVPGYYPDEQMLKKGVCCILIEHLRLNPELKVAQPNLREYNDNLIKKHNAYEAVLYKDSLISEGSRSNLFFIVNNHLQTAPDNMVLSGIIRGKVLDICRSEGIEVYMQPLKLQDLSLVEAAFITGTSPRILPIKQIGDFQLKVPHPLVTLLMDKLNSLIRG